MNRPKIYLHSFDQGICTYVCFTRCALEKSSQFPLCCVFRPAFGCLQHPKAVKSLKKLWNEQKRLKNGWKKCFDQLSGAASTRKLVEINNTSLFVLTRTKVALILLTIFCLSYSTGSVTSLPNQLARMGEEHRTQKPRPILLALILHLFSNTRGFS